jgi:hypothetical protein
MVHLQHVADEYGDQGVVVLGVNTADTEDKVRELRKQKKVSYPCIVDSSDALRQVASNRYGSSSVPMNYILDRKGRIAASFAGYSEGDERGVNAIKDLLAGREVRGVRAPKSVFGRVRMSDGAPLAGARVSLLPVGGRGSYGGTADAEGGYEVVDVPAGEYRVLVHLIGRFGFSVPAGKVLVAPDKAVEHNWKLESGTIEGRILLKETGRPLHYLDVNVWAHPGPYFATPDENGRYRLVGLPPGTYTVRISPKSPAVGDVERIVELDETAKGVDFELEALRTGRVRLRIRDASGKPCRKLEFTLLIPGGGRSLHGKYVDEGVWEFELEIGERTISIVGASQLVKVRVEDEATVEKSVQLR